MKLLLRLKWIYSRWLVKRRNIGFKKFLARMYWFQELEKLPQYNQTKLARFGYFKMRRLFIKEFPNKYLHNPYTD